MQPDTVPLPAPVIRALDQIAAELMNMPRECCRDFQEMMLWKGRVARKVRAVTQMRLARPTVPPARPQASPSRLVSPRDAAEAVFGSGGQPAAKRAARRTVTSRKGRAVVVETRQLAFWSGS